MHTSKDSQRTTPAVLALQTISRSHRTKNASVYLRYGWGLGVAACLIGCSSLNFSPIVESEVWGVPSGLKCSEHRTRCLPEEGGRSRLGEEEKHEREDSWRIEFRELDVQPGAQGGFLITASPIIVNEYTVTLSRPREKGIQRYRMVKRAPGSMLKTLDTSMGVGNLDPGLFDILGEMATTVATAGTATLQDPYAGDRGLGNREFQEHSVLLIPTDVWKWTFKEWEAVDTWQGEEDVGSIPWKLTISGTSPEELVSEEGFPLSIGLDGTEIPGGGQELKLQKYGWFSTLNASESAMREAMERELSNLGSLEEVEEILGWSALASGIRKGGVRFKFEAASEAVSMPERQFVELPVWGVPLGDELHAYAKASGHRAIIECLRRRLPVDRLRALLDAGADPNGDQSLSSLEEAVSHEASLEVVELLLQSGAEVQADPRSEVPILCAAIAAKRPAAIIRALLRGGASPNGRTPKGHGPLHYAVDVSAGLEIMELLLEAGSRPNARDASGVTPLMLASASPHVSDKIQLLASSGAELEATSESGSSALHFAAAAGSKETVQALLDLGADVNSTDAEGMTPLMVAGRYSTAPAILSALLEAGSNPKAKSEAGLVAVEYAKANARLVGTPEYWALNDATFE